MAIDELVPNKHRGVTNVLLWATSLPFSSFGPVIARAMITYTAARWRGIYCIGGALSATSTILFFLFYHPPNFELLHKGRKKTLMVILQMVDVGGIFLMAGGLIIFLLGISWGGQQ